MQKRKEGQNYGKHHIFKVKVDRTKEDESDKTPQKKLVNASIKHIEATRSDRQAEEFEKNELKDHRTWKQGRQIKSIVRTRKRIVRAGKKEAKHEASNQTEAMRRGFGQRARPGNTRQKQKSQNREMRCFTRMDFWKPETNASEKPKRITDRKDDEKENEARIKQKE
jgi:hypothetical protein